MNEFKKTLVNNFELIFWLSAMLILALSDPAKASHFELCPLKLLGINWCPGCGLGHAISYIFHGDITQSWRVHWLGVPAIIIIFRRICFLFPVFLHLEKLKANV